MKTLHSLVVVSVLLLGQVASAAGITVYGAEIGIGKFHRKDNSVHPYATTNAWFPYVLGANADLTTPKIIDNADGSVSIFFSTLDEFVKAMIDVSTKKGTTISSVNLNAHGLPGGLWFPVDDATKNSSDCSQWVTAASGSDEDNYNQYYSPVSKDEVMQIRAMAQGGLGGLFGAPCTVGVNEWEKVFQNNPGIKTALSPAVHVNILSCVVGLGDVGEQFATGLGKALGLDGAQIQSSLEFGLGDWSMDQGMGFWDYQTDAQLDSDNSKYPVDRKDSEMMQKGQIRVTTSKGGTWSSTISQNQDYLYFMPGVGIPLFTINSMPATGYKPFDPNVRVDKIRIAGTTSYVQIR